MERVSLAATLRFMKTQRLYLSLFALFCLFQMLIAFLGAIYIGLAEMFGEGGFDDHTRVTLTRDLFTYGGLFVCFSWEALRAHFEVRARAGRKSGPSWRRLGGVVGILAGLAGFLWAVGFSAATVRTYRVMGSWAAGPDGFLILLGLGGAFYFFSLGARALLNRPKR
jgi:hypothetical protein